MLDKTKKITVSLVNGCKAVKVSIHLTLVTNKIDKTKTPIFQGVFEGCYIIPPIPPIPPISGIPPPEPPSSGLSATTASVVRSIAATEAAF